MTPEVRAINHAFERMSDAVDHFQQVCTANNNPIDGITIRCQRNGGRHLKVKYRRLKK